MSENIQLTEIQEIAKDKIEKWFCGYRENHQQIFTLAGYAGTGKTFLVNHIIKNVLHLKDSEVAYVAPTGKAANVLIQRGAINATTIHRLIYNRVETEFETKVGDTVVKSKKFEFIRKPSLPEYKLIILDETSMVSSKIMKDITSYGLPILCCGDPFQLPPPAGESNGLLDRPDITLTEIVRQNADNAIVKLATTIRNGGSLKAGNYGDVVVIPKTLLSDERREYLLTHADQVICGTNSTRKKINKEIKKYLKLDTNTINEGEKVICLLNNWRVTVDDNEDYYLVNGMIGVASDIKELKNTDSKLAVMNLTPDFLDVKSDSLVFDMGNFSQDEQFYQFHQSVCLMGDGRYEIKKQITKGMSRDEMVLSLIQQRDALISEQLNFFDSAYCISCHKSQGAEWDNVVVIDESHCFKKEWRQWLYTAITRARKKLVIII